jgi:glyoxylase-like metal-dependent hydrolase (beta-lactamase superfamily II)/rhodanese-related sulfurtransferase
MTNIDADTLRMWLEDGRPVTVLDVRLTEDRQESAIPGSVHVDAYRALKSNDPAALAHVDLPAGIPVVAVCNAGNTSKIAARQLDARGIEVLSLDGGMRAWGLVWNTADVPVPGSAATVVQVRRSAKGCLSYVIGSAGKAAVIDPSVDPAVYIGICRERGWQIQCVLDTHVHADHVSRARPLATTTGAELVLPQNNRAAFLFRPIRNGEVLSVGESMLTALYTPGHTNESMSFVLDGRAVFTGDTLFVRGVGRPDLHNSPEAAVIAARRLHHSLAQLLALGPETVVLPGHTAGPVPFDRTPVCTTVAAVRSANPLLAAGEEEFSRTIVASLPPTPPNYSQITRVNESDEPLPDDLAQLEAGANRCAIT